MVVQWDIFPFSLVFSIGKQCSFRFIFCPYNAVKDIEPRPGRWLGGCLPCKHDDTPTTHRKGMVIHTCDRDGGFLGLASSASLAELQFQWDTPSQMDKMDWGRPLMLTSSLYTNTYIHEWTCSRELVHTHKKKGDGKFSLCLTIPWKSKETIRKWIRVQTITYSSLVSWKRARSFGFYLRMCCVARTMK